MAAAPSTPSQSRTALITGASAGIGREFSRVFAARGFALVLVARREERLMALSDELSSAHGVSVRVIAADLADPKTPQRIFEELTRAGVTVDALVNNAGYAILETLLTTPWAQQAALIQVMVTSVTELCRLFAPGMAERGYGRIINLSSTAAFAPPQRGSLYSASKSFVVHMSQGLAAELGDRNVNVTVLCPGFTHTEFHEVMGVAERVGRLPRFMWMNAREVAEQGVDAVMSGRTVYVNGWINRLIALLCRFLPTSLIQRRRPRLTPQSTTPPPL